MKRCCTCRESLPLEAFHRRSASLDGRQSRCKACCRDQYAQRRDELYAKIKARSVRLRERKEELLAAYLCEYPCVDCGERDLRVLDLDHRDPVLKRLGVGVMMTGGWTWAATLREIEKCDVRCANCHRIRTSHQQLWWKQAYERAGVAARRTCPCGGYRRSSPRADCRSQDAQPTGRMPALVERQLLTTTPILVLPNRMAHTARPPGPAPVEAADDHSCVVAVCQGHRCQALLAGQEPAGLAALRQAVAGSRLGVLVTTGCTGRCADGPVVVVGVGRHEGGRLQVATQATLGPVGPAHVRLLGEHLRSGPGPLPPLLGEVRLPAGARR